MMARHIGRTLVLVLGLLALLGTATVPAAAAPPPEPEAELYPPDGNHGDPSRRAAPNQQLTVRGNVSPDRSGFKVFLDQKDTAGQVIKTNDITGLVSPDANGDFSVEVNPIEEPATDTIHVRATVTNADGTTSSSPDQLSFVTVDRIAPTISGYALTSTTTIRVTFSENVWHPNENGDNPSDWTVTSDDGSSQTPTRVEKPTGDQQVRILHLGDPLGPNETPTVDYEAQVFGLSVGPYEDEVQQDLALDGREQQATDAVPPDPPTVDQIDGESVPAQGNDPTPTIRVTDLTAGDTAEVFLEAGEADSSMGSATAGSDGTATITVPDGKALGDGDPPQTYSFYARATDPAGNASDPGTLADYTLDTVRPVAQSAVVDPDENGNDQIVAVFFSEAVSGTNGASQWTLSNCGVTGCPNVIGVTGSDGSSERRLQTDGPVPSGADLAWSPPASGAYQDAAGNTMSAFSGLDVAAELPAFVEALPAGAVLEGAPGSSSHATFTVHLTKPETLPVIVTWRTEDGTAKAGEDYESSSGLVTFLVGQTEQQVNVPIEGDRLDEPDETFFIVLDQSTGAPVADDSRRASATITDDDPPVGMAIGPDVRLTETDGATQVTLPITLSTVSGKQVSVGWTTASGGAAAGSDFTSATGTATFEPGETSRSITIAITGDTTAEPDETFQVALGSPVNATITRATATVTIVNDDASVVSSACPAEHVPAADFEDVSGTHSHNIACASWYAIALGRGDTDGDGQPEYEPGEDVTRAQMASFIARLLAEAGVVLPTNPSNAFEDDDDSTHRTAIDQLAALGIVKGRADEGDSDRDGDRSEVLYFPDEPVTRAQMASFIARGHAEASTPLPAGSNRFEDDDRSPHRDNIDAIAAAGIANGRQDTGDADGDGNTSEFLYFPDEAVSRAQMASFLLRDLGVLVDDGVAYVGGADTTMTDSTAPPGGQVTGRVHTNKQVVSLLADGCGLNDHSVSVDGDGDFTITIPSDQPSGGCTLELSVTTQRFGSDVEQTVTHLEPVTVS